MHRRLAAIGVIDLRTAPIEMVHHAANSPFVAGNVASGKDDGVAFLDLQVLVIVERKPRERRHRLALASAGDDAYFVSRIISDFLRPNHESGRNFEETK